MQDEGQEITVCRIDPTGTKMLAAKGTIVASAGYDGRAVDKLILPGSE